MAFGISQPFLHLRIVTFQQALVAIVEIGLPRGGDDETTPVRAATCRIGVGGGVGHVTVLALAVCPCLHPVHVERSQVEEGLCGGGGGVAVAAIAQTLNLRTVHHIAAQREGVQGVVHHFVYLVHVLVRAGKGGFSAVAGAHHAAGDLVEGQRVFQPLYHQVAVALVVELAGEAAGLFAVAYIIVGVQVFAEAGAVLHEEVVIVQLNLLSGIHHRHHHVCETHKVVSHVIDETLVAGLYYRNGVERTSQTVGLAHLWGGLVCGDVRHRNRIPLHSVQRVGVQVFGGVSLVHNLTAHAVCPPVAEGVSSALCGLPAFTGGHKCSCAFGCYGVKLCPYKGTALGGTLVVFLIPAFSNPDDQFVCAFLQQRCHVVCHDERTLAKLAYSRGKDCV